MTVRNLVDPSIRLLRTNRSYRRYWVGQSISVTGSQVTVMALPLVSAVALHAGPRQVGMVATAATLPYLLFSLVAGHVLEGRSKRAVMIAADLTQAAVLGLVPIAWAGGFLNVPLLVAVAFISGVASLCFGVVGFSYVPDLVDDDDLAAANRAFQGSRTTAEVAGPGLAGALVGALGAPLAIAVDAISYFASAAGISGSHPRRTANATSKGGATRIKDETARSDLTSGLTLLFKNPYLRSLTLHAALYNLAEEVFLLNLVLWAVQHQHLSPTAYGVALAGAGVGGLIGTATALRVSERVGLGRAFVLSLVLSCGTPVLAVMVDTTGATLAAAIGVVMLISGIGLGNANVYSLTLRQSAIPREQLTRSAGAYTQVMYGSIPLGGILAGALGSALGVRWAAATGALLLIASIIPMCTRRIWALPTPADAAN